MPRSARRLGSRRQGAPPISATLFGCQPARHAGGPLTAGNRSQVLEGGDVAYPQMLAAIAAAKHCIALASYIFRDDAAGTAFADALIAAQARGVAGACAAGQRGHRLYPFRRSFSASRWPACKPRASCTPGCPGACRFSTCAITASCWWWMAASPSWAASISERRIAAAWHPNDYITGHPFPHRGAGGAADAWMPLPATGPSPPTKHWMTDAGGRS